MAISSCQLVRVGADFSCYVFLHISVTALGIKYRSKQTNQNLFICPFLQEKKIQFSQKLDQVKDKGKEWIGKVKETREKGNEMMNRWEEKSKEFIGNFIELFGKEGKIVSIIQLIYELSDSLQYLV